MDRNQPLPPRDHVPRSLSARRAWIEIGWHSGHTRHAAVALRKESVDRNVCGGSAGAGPIVALRKESVDRNGVVHMQEIPYLASLSARRAWIEINALQNLFVSNSVALRKESVDRNKRSISRIKVCIESLSARRAWIEIQAILVKVVDFPVALRKESVDRNAKSTEDTENYVTSLSARRAWIEIVCEPNAVVREQGRSPQGERG